MEDITKNSNNLNMPQQKNAPDGPSSIEEAKKRMVKLRTQILAFIQVPAQDVINTEVQTQYKRVEESSRLVPLLEEARLALKDFETLLEERAFSDKKNMEEFHKLNDLVNTLKVQRDEAVKNFETIESKLRQEVQQERQSHKQEIEEMETRVVKELEHSAEGFLKQIEDMELKKSIIIEKKSVKEKEVAATKAKLEAIIQEAFSKLSPNMYEAQIVLQGMTPGKSYERFINEVEAFRNNLGFFSFKQKGIMQEVLKNKQLFLDADKSYQGLAMMGQEIISFDTKITQILEQYKASILDAEKGKLSKLTE